MTELAERLRERFFGADEHPYRTFEREVERLLRPGDTLLDAGCGRAAPVLIKYREKAGQLIGVDLVAFDRTIDGVRLLNEDIGRMSLEDSSADLVMSRSVIEHVAEPRDLYREIHRVLKPSGHFVFLTGNLWDYAALIARLVPNRFHPWIVSRTEGRAEKDVFPVEYKSNTYRSVRKWAEASGFDIVAFKYLGQYPSYFMFNGFLFLIATAYEKLIARIPPLNFLRGWILVTLRKR